MTVSYPGYAPATIEDIDLDAPGFVLNDTTLRLVQYCLSTDSDELDKTLTLGDVQTDTLTIFNDGAKSGELSLAVFPEDFVAKRPS